MFLPSPVIKLRLSRTFLFRYRTMLFLHLFEHQINACLLFLLTILSILLFLCFLADESQV